MFTIYGLFELNEYIYSQNEGGCCCFEKSVDFESSSHKLSDNFTFVGKEKQWV